MPTLGFRTNGLQNPKFNVRTGVIFQNLTNMIMFIRFRPRSALCPPLPQRHLHPNLDKANAMPPAQKAAVATSGILALAFLIRWVKSDSATVVKAILGLLLGVTLFHSRFGFTSAWRQLISVGQGRALQAHMLMLAVAVVGFSCYFEWQWIL